MSLAPVWHSAQSSAPTDVARRYRKVCGAVAHPASGTTVASLHPCPNHAVGAAVTRRYSALIGIVAPLAAGALGNVTVSSPCLKVAVTLEASTGAGNRMARAKAPYERSAR